MFIQGRRSFLNSTNPLNLVQTIETERYKFLVFIDFIQSSVQVQSRKINYLASANSIVVILTFVRGRRLIERIQYITLVDGAFERHLDIVLS